MNKIKLLYDITRTMKNLDRIAGVLTVKVRRDEEEVFSLTNRFEKNGGGKTRTVVSTALNLEGAQVTRESTTEFDLSGRCHGHHGFLRRMMHRQHGKGCCCGVKGALSRLSMALGILGSIEVQEKESGTALVTLDLKQAPEELRAALKEKLQHKHDCLAQHGLIGEGHQVDALDGALVVRVNEDKTIQGILFELRGTERDEEQEEHSMSAFAEVEFA